MFFIFCKSNIVAPLFADDLREFIEFLVKTFLASKSFEHGCIKDFAALYADNSAALTALDKFNRAASHFCSKHSVFDCRDTDALHPLECHVVDASARCVAYLLSELVRKLGLAFCKDND